MIAALARRGSGVYLYTFYGRRSKMPLFSLCGPSRLATEVIEPGELEQLFG